MAQLCATRTTRLWVLAEAPSEGLDALPGKDGKMEVERQGGARATFLANRQPLRNDAGEFNGAVNRVHDITEQPQRKPELARHPQDFEDVFGDGLVGLHLVAADVALLHPAVGVKEGLEFAPRNGFNLASASRPFRSPHC
jgi:hypothetical protein